MDSLPTLASVSGLVHFTQYLKWAETVAAKRAGLNSKRSTGSNAAPFENNNTSKKSAVQIGPHGVSLRLSSSSASSSSFGGASRSGRRVLSSVANKMIAGCVKDLVNEGGMVVNASAKTYALRGLFVFELFPSLRASAQRCDGSFTSDTSPADLKWAREVCDALSDGVALLYLAVSLASSSAKPQKEFDSSTNAADRRVSSFWYESAISTSLAEWCLTVVEGGEAVRGGGSFSHESGHNNGSTPRERIVSVLVALEAEVSRLSMMLSTKSKCAHDSRYYARDVVLPSFSSSDRSPSRAASLRSDGAKGASQAITKTKGRDANEGQLNLASRIFSGNFEAIAYTLHILFMAYVGKERLDRIPQMLSWYADLADGGYGLSTLGLSIIAKGSEFCRSVGSGEVSSTLTSGVAQQPLKRIASIFADGTLWVLALDNALRMRSLFSRYERVGELDNEGDLGIERRSKMSGNMKNGYEASSVNDSSNELTRSIFVTASGLDLSQIYLCPMTVEERCHNMRLWGLAMRKLGVYSYFDFPPGFAGRNETVEGNQNAQLLSISAMAPTPLFLLLQSFFIYNYVRHTSLGLCGRGSLAGRKIVNEMVVRRRMLRVGRAAAAGGFGVANASADSDDEALEEGVPYDANSSKKSIRVLFNDGIYPQLHSAICELRIPSIVSTAPHDVANNISFDYSFHCSPQDETERREDITFNIASFQKKDVQQLPACTATRGAAMPQSSLVESCERRGGDNSRVSVTPSIEHKSMDGPHVETVVSPIPQQTERSCEGEMLEGNATSERVHKDAHIHVWSFSLRKNDKKSADFATASRKNSVDAGTDVKGQVSLIEGLMAVQPEGRLLVHSKSPRNAGQSDSSNYKKTSVGYPPSIYDRVNIGPLVSAKKDRSSVRVTTDGGDKPSVVHIHIDPIVPSSVDEKRAEAAMLVNRGLVSPTGKRGLTCDRRPSLSNAADENRANDDGLELLIEEAASDGDGEGERERQSQPLTCQHLSGGSAHREGTACGATHFNSFTSRKGEGGGVRPFRGPTPKDGLREAFDTRGAHQMNCNNPHGSLFVVDLN